MALGISFHWPLASGSNSYRRGDLVVYRKSKYSAHPGPRAKQISPEPLGEGYRYEVDKFWVVVEARENGQVLLRTRRGKEHLVAANHPCLRRAHWWERLLHRLRFPNLESPEAHGC